MSNTCNTNSLLLPDCHSTDQLHFSSLLNTDSSLPTTRPSTTQFYKIIGRKKFEKQVSYKKNNYGRDEKNYWADEPHTLYRP